MGRPRGSRRRSGAGTTSSISSKKAEQSTPVGDYMMYGPRNNMKLYPRSHCPDGRTPEERRKVWKTYMGMRATPGFYLPEEEQRTTIGLLFPGQGSQYVGMLQKAMELPAVKEMAAAAKKILGWDVVALCTKGPASELEKTSKCQAAVYVTNLAALELLKEKRAEAALHPGAVAGLAAGEMAALVAAGVMTFEDGLILVKARGEAIEDAVKQGPPQGMLTVAGIRYEKLKVFCEQVTEEMGPDAVCDVSNVLFPKGMTVSGTLSALERLEKIVKENGALQAKLDKTQGAFHTELMESAKEKFQDVVADVKHRMKAPHCSIYMCTSGNALKPNSSPKDICHLMCKQLTWPIMWERAVKNMIRDGISEFYEVGPKQQLKLMMKRIDANMFEDTQNIDV
eukprot:gnl/TRDRNA2_/TRDRNA2_138516_c0_seq1.p1 gnl/TRDRNA2_/TRDRNA2_138516_c0~~gnl/TRDRNA2_/TRDRNA2_138516_c0_seq1.p1  ORF type:complete len:396 (+),score=102.11 gnl/TRDRNA2_/TRDRNA2_138516_c0_seq1:105-1292(+)